MEDIRIYGWGKGVRVGVRAVGVVVRVGRVTVMGNMGHSGCLKGGGVMDRRGGQKLVKLVELVYQGIDIVFKIYT